MSISLIDVRGFIRDVKCAFYDKEEEMNNALRYSMIKGIVCLRMEETKLMAKEIDEVD